MADQDFSAGQHADETADQGFDWDALLGPGEAESEPEIPFDDIVEQPVAVEHTDAIYRDFASRFGAEESRKLQAAWGDSALHNEAIIRAFMQDTPAVEQIYSQHAAEDGGLGLKALELGMRQIMAGFQISSPDELERQHPELRELFFDHLDEARGVLSPTGVLRMLEYIARTKGYRYKHHGGQK